MNVIFRSRGFSRAFYSIFLLFLILLLFYFFQLNQTASDHENNNGQEISDEQYQHISFEKQVKPILDRRCVVCHSCYDAPCQLKLSSAEGIRRGASKIPVYNSERISASPPTRLFIDARNEQEWRQKGFYSVLPDGADRPQQSLMGMLLELKQQHPQPGQGKLPEAFTLGLNREQQCVDGSTVEDYKDNHPLWGMPYAMPNLSRHENNMLFGWLKQGAPMGAPLQPTAELLKQVKHWEDFLNQPSKKSRLMSRYLYEHLFHAHIHFKGSPDNIFYRLVRATGLDGQIEEIPTLRPYDDPGPSFYYRLRPYKATIVAKSHIVYELSDARMQRYKALFMEPDYQVSELPSYSPEITANPFKVFRDIPPDSRYRFMLDEARFFIEGFIKGPVCRGQVALSVIEDQFWVVFFNPDEDFFTTQSDFLDSMSDYLRIPSERKSHINLLAIWSDYWQRQKRYMYGKQAYFRNMQQHDLKHAMNYIWDGEGENPNAALTVFRNFDSATVEYGFVGDEPETAWIIDYPLLERIHYLLVAGFNVYGNLVHQLSTRIYMDFLRMEGEDHFLAFLPVEKRKQIRDKWYQGIRAELDDLFTAPMDWLNVESVTGYQRDDVQSELYDYLKQRMKPILQEGLSINYCGQTPCNKPSPEEDRKPVDLLMAQLADIKGEKLHLFPEVSFVRVVNGGKGASYNYTILRNKAYKNVISMLSDERYRDQQDIEKDSLTILNWLSGSYPNFFFTVEEKDLPDFIEHCRRIGEQNLFDEFIERYGVRRTSADFWSTADWFQDSYQKQRPLYSGLFDLSRYGNL